MRWSRSFYLPRRLASAGSSRPDRPVVVSCRRLPAPRRRAAASEAGTARRGRTRSLSACLIVLAASAAAAGQPPGSPPPAPASPPPFEVVEASIADIHAAMKAGRITCRALVAAYLRRIDAYDKNGPALNAIVAVNPDAEKLAEELDRRFAQSGPVGPLHCIPVIVKDNFETVGLQSAAGSLALAGFVSTKDAFQVRRIKEAGAIVLAKSNMAEFAFSPYETVSSILPGYTRNPYDLARVTAGSSGGTAAAVAASFGAVGLGTDTGNSIRGPSAHQALAGIRSTMGLTSRAGVVPLNLLADIAGPIARTMEDAVAVFQVVAGEDPDDPVTAAARGRVARSYAASLRRDALAGARIGVLRQAYERETTDAEVVQVFERALADLARAGAIIVDPARVEGLDEIRRPQGSPPCAGFKHDIDRYLAAHGDRVPVRSLEQIVKSGRFHPSVQRRLEMALAAPENGLDSPACEADRAYREAVRTAVLKTMDALKLDAFVYPTWSNPPRLIGDLNTPHGDNSQFFSPVTGFPAVNVPMGYTRGGLLPAGITFFGRAWSEPALFGYAYAYEQATRHRRPPPTTPPLR
jgi:Asp-tRNA(Asn)/Glu-tRNA(Gln) amidotransferase A subunit family amidase